MERKGVFTTKGLENLHGDVSIATKGVLPMGIDNKHCARLTQPLKERGSASVIVARHFLRDGLPYR